MRLVPLAAAICMFAVPSTADAQFTPDVCAAIAPTVSKLSEATASAERGTMAGNFAPIVDGSSGALKAAAQRAQAARDRVAAALRDYRVSTEDLAYQLRVCAR